MGDVDADGHKQQNTYYGDRLKCGLIFLLVSARVRMRVQAFALVGDASHVCDSRCRCACVGTAKARTFCTLDASQEASQKHMQHACMFVCYVYANGRTRTREAVSVFGS